MNEKCLTYRSFQIIVVLFKIWQLSSVRIFVKSDFVSPVVVRLKIIVVLHVERYRYRWFYECMTRHTDFECRRDFGNLRYIFEHEWDTYQRVRFTWTLDISQWFEQSTHYKEIVERVVIATVRCLTLYDWYQNWIFKIDPSRYVSYNEERRNNIETMTNTNFIHDVEILNWRSLRESSQ